MSKWVNSYERKRGDEFDGSTKIDGGVEQVDRDKGVLTGNALESDVIVTDVEPRINPAALSIEAFMAQELTVRIHDPSNDQDPKYVELNVNGDYRLLVRDSAREQRVKRYHVALLAQAKTARVVQKPHTDSEGFQSWREEVQLRLSYPFNVEHDPAGQKGRDWLRPLVTGANA